MVRIIIAVAVLALPAVLVLSGCGGGKPKDPVAEGRLEIDLSGSDWKLRGLSWHSSETAVAASVPGDINDALLQAGRINITGDLYFGTNLAKSEVMQIAYQSWWLNKTFQLPATWSASTVQHLVFEGIDYNATIFLSTPSEGLIQLGSASGQYQSVNIDVSRLLEPGNTNEICVLFHPPPKTFLDQWLAPGNAVQGVMYDYLDWWKSMVGMGYDFGQSIWTQGLYKPVKLIGTVGPDGLQLSDLAVLPAVSPPFAKATIYMTVVVDMVRTKIPDGLPAKLRWHVACMTNKSAPEAAGHQVVQLVPGRSELNFTLELDTPALWWPRGFGPQHLYKADVMVTDAGGDVADNVSRSFGVRDLQEAENTGPASWRYIEEFTCGPKDDPSNCTFPPADATPAEVKSNRSWTFQINGRKVFAHGANWIPCDMMLGKCGKAQYEYLLRMAAEANHNYLRIWGGGGIEKEEFYELADSLGIMIYQEMVHSQAMPVREANFAAEALEVEAAVKRIRSHPSLVRYGWGNEFYGINRTSNRFERQFEDIANRLDGGRRAHHGSPVTWAQRHGPYCFYFSEVGGGGPFPCAETPGYVAYNEGTMNQEGPNDPFEWDEYGASGIASEFSLRRMIPSEHLFPINSTQEDWLFHRGFDAVGVSPEWLDRTAYVPMFGEPSDLTHEIYASQFAQSEGLRYANQAQRRSMPHRSLSAYWAFNEAWPNAAYGTVVEFAGPLKMAYYAAAKRPYAETDVSLRYDKLAFAEGSRLPASVWCVSEALQPFDAHVQATMLTTGGSVLGQQNWTIRAGGPSQGPGTSHQLGDLSFDVPAYSTATVVLVRLQVTLATSLYTKPVRSLSAGHVVSEEVYTFGVLPTGHTGGDWKGIAPPFSGLWTAPSVAVTLEVHTGDRGNFVATMRNPSSAPALYVELKALTKSISEHDQFHPAVFSDNFVVLFGGEELSINFELLNGFHAPLHPADTVCISGWNAPRVCTALPAATALLV